EVGLDPAAGGEADALHPSNPHAPHGNRRADPEPVDGAEPRGEHLVTAVEPRVAEPEAGGDHEQQRAEDGDADRELVAALHTPASMASGRPSRNWRTTGSSVACISATVPAWRILPW